VGYNKRKYFEQFKVQYAFTQCILSNTGHVYKTMKKSKETPIICYAYIF